LKKNYNIRDSLVANKESQTSFKRRIQREAFGIYRPLTDDSFQKIYEILAGAKVEIDEYLTQRRKSSAEVILPDQMGITFVGLQNARKTMRHKRIIQNGFDFKQLHQSVEEYNSNLTAPLEVPIDQLDWYSRHRRRLVGKLAMGEGMEEISENYESIGDILQLARGEKIRVSQPDHVSLFRYGRNRDNLDLSHRHRNNVAEIVQEHLDYADIGAVILDKIVIGKTYTQPIPIQ